MSYREAATEAPLLLFATYVLALDRATGQERWKYETGHKSVLRFVIDGERVFVYDEATVLHCIAIADGRRLGAVALNLGYGANMMLDAGTLYITGDRDIVALDRDGRVLWKKPIAFNRGFSLCGLAVPGGNSTQPDYATTR